jgi:DNA repair protein RadC
MEINIKVSDLPKNERPRERLLRYGAEALSNAELLAIVLRTGTSKENILGMSNRIIKICGGFQGLFSITAKDLMSINGVGEAKATQILAIIEMNKRYRSFQAGEAIKITTPKDAANIVMENMRCLKKECMKVIMLNTKNMVLSVKEVSVGSLNSSIVHPREVFTEAIKQSSSSIIICHNHPSGDPTPSKEDINVTLRLKEVGELIGILLTDGIYVSLKEKGIL